MSLGMTSFTIVAGGRAAGYELCQLFSSSVGYWEVYRRLLQGFFLGGFGGHGGLD